MSEEDEDYESIKKTLRELRNNPKLRKQSGFDRLLHLSRALAHHRKVTGKKALSKKRDGSKIIPLLIKRPQNGKKRTRRERL